MIQTYMFYVCATSILACGLVRVWNKVKSIELMYWQENPKRKD